MVGVTRWAACLALCGIVWAQPVRPHPANPHYFLFRGTPLVIVSAGEHYGAVLNGDFDWRKYLETLERDGMNYTRVFSGAYREVPGDFGIERNTLAPVRYVAPWAMRDGQLDLEQWNPEYFSRLRDFVAEAGRRGVIVELTLFCSTYGAKQWSVSPFNPANNRNSTSVSDWKQLHTLANGNVLAHQERLVRRIVGELKEFDNVIYEIQNEPWSDRPIVAESLHPYSAGRWPNSADVADKASLDWQRRVAEWIRSEEAGLKARHMIAWNVCNYRLPLKEMLAVADSVNFHYAYPEAAQWNYGLNVPVGYDETGFLKTEDAAYRRQAWRFLMAGGGLFNHLDYSFSVGKEDGTDAQPKSPGGGSPALRRQLRVLREFVESLPYLKMEPDASVVAHAPGAVAQALGAPGEAYAIYLTGSGPTDLKLRLPAGGYEVTWVEPAGGAAIRKDTLTHAGGTAVLHTPEFKEELALKVSNPAARK